jgi:hypothetical protein
MTAGEALGCAAALILAVAATWRSRTRKGHR